MQKVVSSLYRERSHLSSRSLSTRLRHKCAEWLRRTRGKRCSHPSSAGCAGLKVLFGLGKSHSPPGRVCAVLNSSWRGAQFNPCDPRGASSLYREKILSTGSPAWCSRARQEGRGRRRGVVGWRGGLLIISLNFNQMLTPRTDSSSFVPQKRYLTEYHTVKLTWFLFSHFIQNKPTQAFIICE